MLKMKALASALCSLDPGQNRVEEKQDWRVGGKTEGQRQAIMAGRKESKGGERQDEKEKSKGS